MKFLKDIFKQKNTSLNELSRVKTKHNGIRCMDLSQDGKLVITAGIDKVCRVWELATMAEISTFTCHTSTVMSVQFSEDASTIVSTEQSGDSTRLWNTFDGKERVCIKSPEMGWASAMDDQGVVLTGCNQHFGRLWYKDTALEIVRLGVEHELSRVGSVDLSKDGSWALTSEIAGTVRLWRQVSSGNWVEHYRLGSSRRILREVKFGPTGEHFVVTGGINPVEIFETRSVKLIQSLPEETTGSLAAVLSENGLAISNLSRNRVTQRGVRWWDGAGASRFGLWDIASEKKLLEVETNSAIFCIAISGYLNTVIAGLEDELVVWQLDRK